MEASTKQELETRKDGRVVIPKRPDKSEKEEVVVAPPLKIKATNPVVRAALGVVNVIRTTLGEEPLADLPKGYVGDASMCPIATAIPGPAAVGSSITFSGVEEARAAANALRQEGYVVGRSGDAVTVQRCPSDPAVGSNPITEFVNQFDDGRHGFRKYRR